MTTVATFIDSARYDLRDYQTGLAWDDDEILEYVNRMVKVLDSTLASMNSSFVHGTEDETLASAANYIDLRTNLNGGKWDSIRSVWISSTQLEKLSVDEMYYERKFITETGQPYFWALENPNIIFEKTSDAVYTIRIHYNKKTGTLTSASTIPYNDVFNEIFRELLVMHAQAKRENKIMQADQLYTAMFRQRAAQEQLRMDYIPKIYKLGF